MTWQGFPAALCLFRFQIIADDGDGVEDGGGFSDDDDDGGDDGGN